MAGPPLTDAMDATEALLDAVRIPRQVVVDHHVGDLQVDTLAGSVGRHQHLRRRVHPETVLNRSPVVALDPAVDDDHRVRTTQLCRDPLLQIGERVLVFGEHDQLVGGHVVKGSVVFTTVTTVAGVRRRRREATGTQQFPKLHPLGVLTTGANPVGQLDQAFQFLNLRRKLIGGARRSGGVYHLALQLLPLIIAVVVEIEILKVGDPHTPRQVNHWNRVARSGQAAQFRLLIGQPVPTATQRVIDRRRRRRQPTL